MLLIGEQHGIGLILFSPQYHSWQARFIWQILLVEYFVGSCRPRKYCGVELLLVISIRM